MDLSYLLFYSFFISCISIFLDNAMDKGMIFHFWRKFLELKFYHQYRFIDGVYRQPNKKNNVLVTLYKILGGCVYCTNVYLSIVFWYVFFSFNSIVFFAFFIMHIGVNNVIISIYDTLSLYIKNLSNSNTTLNQFLLTEFKKNQMNIAKQNTPMLNAEKTTHINPS